MKLTLSLIAIIISGNLFAQTTRVTNEDKASGMSEKYYVLKSDKKIKEGKYATYSIFGDKLLCEGFYKNDLKDSTWKYYSFQNKLAESGKYEKGEKTGIWSAYDYQGDLQVQYDFTNKKVLVYHPSKQDSIKRQYYVIKGSDTVKTMLDRAPIFLDGQERFSRQMISGMHYPKEARDIDVQGKVIIGFTIDLKGNISNYRVKKGLGYGCDEEALKAVKQGVNGDWLPGILNGNPVIVDYEVPVSFTLESK